MNENILSFLSRDASSRFIYHAAIFSCRARKDDVIQRLKRTSLIDSASNLGFLSGVRASIWLIFIVAGAEH